MSKMQDPMMMTQTRIMEQDQDGGIQWAGSRHDRNSFNKKKDMLTEWTNVLFRAWTLTQLKILARQTTLLTALCLIWKGQLASHKLLRSGHGEQQERNAIRFAKVQ